MMKPWKFLATAVALGAATMAAAQDAPLEKLDTWGRNRGWEAVGLLEIAGTSTCTGVMIAADLVLTAAHCLLDPKTGQAYDPRRVEFRAGLRDGRPVARRAGKAAVVHPGFASTGRLAGKQIRNDVGLLQLADPILTTHADPFLADGGARTGQTVSVVSYGQGRNETASRQRSCEVLEAEKGILAMSCDVVPGSSGSPVFGLQDGRPRVVAVVSALGVYEGRQVSFGMDIRKPLAEVMAEFRAGRGNFANQPTAAKRLGVGSERGGGARFLRP